MPQRPLPSPKPPTCTPTWTTSHVPVARPGVPLPRPRHDAHAWPAMSSQAWNMAVLMSKYAWEGGVGWCGAGQVGKAGERVGRCHCSSGPRAAARPTTTERGRAQTRKRRKALKLPAPTQLLVYLAVVFFLRASWASGVGARRGRTTPSRPSTPNPPLPPPPYSLAVVVHAGHAAAARAAVVRAGRLVGPALAAEPRPPALALDLGQGAACFCVGGVAGRDAAGVAEHALQVRVDRARSVRRQGQGVGPAAGGGTVHGGQLERESE